MRQNRRRQLGIYMLMFCLFLFFNLYAITGDADAGISLDGETVWELEENFQYLDGEDSSTGKYLSEISPEPAAAPNKQLGKYFRFGAAFSCVVFFMEDIRWKRYVKSSVSMQLLLSLARFLYDLLIQWEKDGKKRAFVCS